MYKQVYRITRRNKYGWEDVAGAYCATKKEVLAQLDTLVAADAEKGLIMQEDGEGFIDVHKDGIWCAHMMIDTLSIYCETRDEKRMSKADHCFYLNNPGF